MDIISPLLPPALFSLACNLDTLVLSLGFALRGLRLPLRHSLLIAAVTTAVTWLSLAFGDLAACLLPPALPRAVGGLTLVGIGAWFLLDALRRWDSPEPPSCPVPAGLRASVALAAALAVNNAGVGVAAGVEGLPPLLAAACNFAATAVCLLLGGVLGRSPLGRALGRCALPLSGALLVLLGAWGITG